jgi:hypothetical protein
MVLLFFILFFIIKNTYYKDIFIIKSMSKNNTNNKNLIDILKLNIGKDDRNNKENIDITVFENIYKKEMLDNLSNYYYNIDEKIVMINKYWGFKENLNEKELNAFNLKSGGLMNDWNFENF